MTSTTELYRVTEVPVLQNRTFSTSEEARLCPRGDVVLVQDLQTGLVFNEAFDNSLICYGPDYQNEQASSGVFRRHLEDVERIVRRNFSTSEIVEVGCGKGHFIEMLQQKGYTVGGFDPAYEGHNPAVRREYFGPESKTAADAIILRHVLEHIPNPISFLQQILAANGNRGLIYIEVPCFDWICQNRCWFDVYYEHVNYFRGADLCRMFGDVIEHGKLFGGQYIYVVADLSTVRIPPRNGVVSSTIPDDFLDGVRRHSQRLRKARENGIMSVLWGAASKGVIFATFMERSGTGLDAAIDISPAKQGRYLPVTGLPVTAPDDAIAKLRAGSNVFVMNSNYLDEIKTFTGGRYTYIGVENG